MPGEKTKIGPCGGSECPYQWGRPVEEILADMEKGFSDIPGVEIVLMDCQRNCNKAIAQECGNMYIEGDSKPVVGVTQSDFIEPTKRAYIKSVSGEY